MVKVSELFTSIQGEGPYVGYKQIFIRLCGCNLNCAYCDTDFGIQNSHDYTIDELINYCKLNNDVHSVSLTGGEPLLHTDFIKEFSKYCKLPIYLETNGTLYKQLADIIDCVSYISADIKIPSCTKNLPMWDDHEKFFDIASGKILFAKVVFNNEFNSIEIDKVTNLCKKYDIELILQPQMKSGALNVTSTEILKYLDLCLNKYKKVRLIPQVHKFLNII